MELADYLRVIASETDALAGVAETHPRLDVPSCPGWKVIDVGHHIGNVQRWAAAIVRSAEISRQPMGESSPVGAELGRWLRDGAAELVAALEEAGPEKPVWTLGEPRTARFWFRRQAQEVTMHRWDAEDAVGLAPSPIGTDLAADGVAELLEMFLPARHRRAGAPGSGETFHIHRTDGPGEWLIRFEGAEATVAAEHAKGDVAFRGSAPDLLLALWCRRPMSTLEVLGSADVAGRWSDLFPVP